MACPFPTRMLPAATLIEADINSFPPALSTHTHARTHTHTHTKAVPYAHFVFHYHWHTHTHLLACLFAWHEITHPCTQTLNMHTPTYCWTTNHLLYITYPPPDPHSALFFPSTTPSNQHPTPSCLNSRPYKKTRVSLTRKASSFVTQHLLPSSYWQFQDYR